MPDPGRAEPRGIEVFDESFDEVDEEIYRSHNPPIILVLTVSVG